MFGGEIYTTIDGKGRTSMPAKFREVFSDTFGDERFYITKCLVNMGDGTVSRGLSVYPYGEWQSLQDKMDNGVSGLTAAQVNSIKRLILAPGVECVADRQGRVLIPPTLRAYASLERDIVFVGTRKKIEIWNQESWDQVCRQAEADFPDDTAALADLGF
jgi:MraZ protein